MADETAVPSTDDVTAVLAGLQDQIDALVTTLSAHQQLFERLRATGQLPADLDVEQPR